MASGTAAIPAVRTRRRLGALITAARSSSQRLRVRRILLLVSLVAAMVLVLVETPIATGLHRLPLIAAFVLAVLHTAPLPLAVRFPRSAPVLALAAALLLQASSALHAAIWPWWPVLIVTQTLVQAVAATRTTWTPALVQWFVSVGASSLLAAWLRPDDGSATAVNLVVYGGVSGSTVVVAQLLAQWRRIRGELIHERAVTADEVQRRLLMEERARIARELHDVVAHSMSIITVQSTTARFRHPDFGGAAVEEFDRIGELSRQALDEMRALLRVLRGTEDDVPLHPQPGIAALPDLVAHAARAGIAVTLETVDDRGVSEVTGVTAYRIVQEAISNAFRHAPGATVHVACSIDGDRLVVCITNPPPATAPEPTGSPGHGLIGMRERAATVGGAVEARLGADGGFVVRAVLPLRPVPAAGGAA